ncbi:hypothetical protein D7B24_004260 [Verticillium nonalfalfae]|uniref:CBF1-interacting co-repressor CIR N-terminal domain-containing protein n=1 Tax=Verticillium nonalfalfae TaxID=1051616 RepID=A0A3M9XW73_9PEZI|nr:uncharacterized protein D7B24_004260 [Verticillium nonalfalfae]RNJ52135.1 hypothetical protein D7B24_004260 [Verticillium nonalfalfae]
MFKEASVVTLVFLAELPVVPIPPRRKGLDESGPLAISIKMPLHLLGKKSWNVYNADNIARVRRDEAAAKASEEAEEQRMQEVDAERRLAILRGEEPPPLPEPSPEQAVVRHDRHASGHERKKRKRTGEDDTDFELRIAQERSAVVRAHGEDVSQRKTSSAPIVDRNGHIDLFGEERKANRRSEKNEEAEKEAEKKKREYEDQYRMRLSSAPGRGGMLNPWYSKTADDGAQPDGFQASEKDVWGNEDPGRKKRAADRITSSDPLAMMKRGAAKVREVKNERQKLQQERDTELEKMRRDDRRRERRERDERRSERRHRDRKRDGVGELDGHEENRDRRESRHHDRRRPSSSARHQQDEGHRQRDY